jgi:hypothetical protein
MLRIAAAACSLAVFVALAALAQEVQTVAPAAEHEFVTETLRGRVVWEAEALKRKFGVEIDADAADWNVALETTEGKLWPIVKDARGRGFRLDERLRDVDVELLVRRFEDAPVVQVIQVYRLRDGKRYEVDYWCDICSIPMYELKECECCQGPIRLRERLVEDAAGAQNNATTK